jgi:hypothetical protein
MPWKCMGGGMDVSIHISLASALAGDEWSASRPGCFTPRERAPGTHWIGGRVGPRAGLDDVEEIKFLTLPGLELWPLGRPACSQSIYWLHYPGSITNEAVAYDITLLSVNPLLETFKCLNKHLWNLVYHGTWPDLNGILHKSLPSVCLSVCMCILPITARERLSKMHPSSSIWTILLSCKCKIWCLCLKFVIRTPGF